MRRILFGFLVVLIVGWFAGYSRQKPTPEESTELTILTALNAAIVYDHACNGGKFVKDGNINLLGNLQTVPARVLTAIANNHASANLDKYAKRMISASADQKKTLEDKFKKDGCNFPDVQKFKEALAFFTTTPPYIVWAMTEKKLKDQGIVKAPHNPDLDKTPKKKL